MFISQSVSSIWMYYVRIGRLSDKRLNFFVFTFINRLILIRINYFFFINFRIFISIRHLIMIKLTIIYCKYKYSYIFSFILNFLFLIIKKYINTRKAILPPAKRYIHR